MIRAMSLLNTEPIDWHAGEPSIWVDVDSPSPEEMEALRGVFAMNDLALEDALTHGQWSRFEAYPEHVFLVFRTLGDPRADTAETERVSMFWYPATDTLLTVRLGEVEYLDRTWRDFHGLRHGSEERLIYTLLAQGTETFFEFADLVEARTDELEEGMFIRNGQGVGTQDLTQRVFEARHEIMDVRRLVNNARASVSAFARHARVVTAGYGQGLDFSEVRLDPQAQEVALYFRDVVDSLDRVYDTLDSAREVLERHGRESDGAEQPHERGDEDPDGGLGGLPAIDVPRGGLGHELRGHAGTGVALRVPHGVGELHRRRGGVGMVFQAARLVVSGRARWAVLPTSGRVRSTAGSCRGPVIFRTGDLVRRVVGSALTSDVWVSWLSRTCETARPDLVGGRVVTARASAWTGSAARVCRLTSGARSAPGPWAPPRGPAGRSRRASGRAAS